MKRQKWVLAVLVMVLFWAPVARASIIEFSFGGYYNYQNWGFNFNWSENVFLSGDVFFFPEKSGTFDLQGRCDGWFGVVDDVLPSAHFTSPQWEYVTWSCPLTHYNYTLLLDQSGPLQFTDLTAEIKVLQNGVETTILHWSADADILENGGTINGQLSFNLFPDVMVHYEWSSGYDWISYPPLPVWTAHGEGVVDSYPVTLSLTGHVIDTTAPVPVPSALLLVGSGLVRLAFYGRRKVVRRS
jgi:hypothetical protein